MSVRALPWGKLALVALAAILMTSDTTFPDKWALARLLHPAVQPRFLGLLKAIEALGYRIILTSSYRAGGTDPHAYGLALDLNIVHVASGRQYRMADTKAVWEATGVPALVRSQGFRWGGDFTTPWIFKGVTHPGYDPVHIDCCKMYPTSELAPLALHLAGSAAALVNFDRRRVRLAA